MSSWASKLDYIQHCSQCLSGLLIFFARDMKRVKIVDTDPNDPSDGSTGKDSMRFTGFPLIRMGRCLLDDQPGLVH